MIKAKRRAILRKAEKYQRIACDLEADIAALRWAGDDFAANGVQQVSSTLGKISRRMFDEYEGKEST